MPASDSLRANSGAGRVHEQPSAVKPEALPGNAQGAARELRACSARIAQAEAGAAPALRDLAYLRRRTAAIVQCGDLYRLIERQNRTGWRRPELERAADAAIVLASDLFQLQEMEVARADHGASAASDGSELLAAICKALGIPSGTHRFELPAGERDGAVGACAGPERIPMNPPHSPEIVKAERPSDRASACADRGGRQERNLSNDGC